MNNFLLTNDRRLINLANIAYIEDDNLDLDSGTKCYVHLINGEIVVEGPDVFEKIKDKCTNRILNE